MTTMGGETMRRLVLTENITVDGRIVMLDDWFDSSPEGDVSDEQAELERLGEAVDAVLLGRQTFEDFRGYWPDHTDEPAGAYLDTVQKYVVSSSIGDPQWRNSTVLPGDPLDEVRRLKGADVPSLQLLESRAFRSGVVLLRYAVP
jgi:dihydrofolate reductase